MPSNLVTSGHHVPNDIDVILEAGKWVELDGWRGPEQAKAELLARVARFQAELENPQF